MENRYYLVALDGVRLFDFNLTLDSALDCVRCYYSDGRHGLTIFPHSRLFKNRFDANRFFQRHFNLF